MRSMPCAIVLFLATTFALPAHAAQICAWIVESNAPDDVRNLDLWLQSDTDVDFFLKMDGLGIVDGSGHSNSPMNATESLHAGQPDKVWGFGSTLSPPGKIDETAEIHKTPADVFSDAPTPLLAKFVFQRAVPESEKKPPAIFAKKQCAAVSEK